MVQFAERNHEHPVYAKLADLRKLAAALRDHATAAPSITGTIVPVPDVAVSSQLVVTVRLPDPMPAGYVASAQLVGQTAALAPARVVGWQIQSRRRVDVLVRNASATDVLTGVSLLVIATLPPVSPDPND